MLRSMIDSEQRRQGEVGQNLRQSTNKSTAEKRAHTRRQEEPSTLRTQQSLVHAAPRS